MSLLISHNVPNFVYLQNRPLKTAILNEDAAMIKCLVQLGSSLMLPLGETWVSVYLRIRVEQSLSRY